MKNLLKSFFLVLILSGQLISQTWHWVEKPKILNPSGIEVPDNITFFQALDWNHDARWDMIQNNSGTLELYLQASEENQFYLDKSIDLPEIGFYPITPSYPENQNPKNFEFIDWDSDGDFDLATDSSLFWWNNGNNLNPVWIKDDSLLGTVGIGANFSFADIDQDNDWDFVFQEIWSGGAFIFMNSGNNTEPIWQLSDTLETNNNFIFGNKFLNFNNDSLIDMAAIGHGLGDPGTHLFLAFLKNEGTLLEPYWQQVDGLVFSWSALFGGQPVYNFPDFNGDGYFDIIQNDWRRHLFIYLNQNSTQSLKFSNKPDLVYGAINGESKTRPYFFDADDDGLDDLMVFEDFWTFFIIGCNFHESRNTVYKNKNGRFQPDIGIFKNIPRPYNPTYPATFLRDLTISFADIDSDNDVDFIAGFIEVNCSDSIIKKGIIFFENTGNELEPDWQENSTQFTYFSSPDSMFYDPHLIDIDHDNDFDIFLQKAGEYRFYERFNMPEENWQRNKSWESGLVNPSHYSATFADLNLDGLQDLVFGETDGSLSFYENIGTAAQPKWQLNADAFTGINVDSLAVPAFSDITQDGKPDLVIGNADGRLFYYENASIIDAVNQSQKVPTDFRLAQNYPNPFNPETSIKLSIPVIGFVKLEIFNLLGELVRTLFAGQMNPGEYTFLWNGKNDRGYVMPSGLYIYKLQAGSFKASKKMVLLR